MQLIFMKFLSGMHRGIQAYDAESTKIIFWASVVCSQQIICTIFHGEKLIFEIVIY